MLSEPAVFLARLFYMPLTEDILLFISKLDNSYHFVPYSTLLHKGRLSCSSLQPSFASAQLSPELQRFLVAMSLHDDPT